jgi:uncharacterized protein YbaR (Trm112 family)
MREVEMVRNGTLGLAYPLADGIPASFQEVACTGFTRA